MSIVFNADNAVEFCMQSSTHSLCHTGFVVADTGKPITSCKEVRYLNIRPCSLP